MRHEDALELLADWVSDRLAPERAKDVRQHVDGCSECRDATSLLRRVAREVEEHGDSALDDHPSPELLTRYALGEVGSLPELAHLAGHVRACPSCTVEAELVRSTRHGSRSLPHRLRVAMRAPRVGVWPVLGPAFAVLVLLLAYPAYQGLVGPRDAPPRIGEGGSVPLLFLPASRRGDGDLPSIPRPSAAFQPILVDQDFADPEQWGPNDRVRIRLLRTGDAREVWSIAGTASRFADPENPWVSLLVPREVLTRGEFRLEVLADGTTEPRWTARFRVSR